MLKIPVTKTSDNTMSSHSGLVGVQREDARQVLCRLQGWMDLISREDQGLFYLEGDSRVSTGR